MIRVMACLALAWGLWAGAALAQEAGAQSGPQSGSAEATYPVYGARLEGFEYPYETADFALRSQGQDLVMGYMDVAPVEGAANGQTIVLLHGKNFCGATWGATIAVLRDEGYRVIVPDQIGFCRSSKPVGYQFSLDQLAQNTKELLQARGVERAIIMGHSMGGMLAARFALNYPAMVEQLVLVNPIGLEDWRRKGVPYADIDTLYEGELQTSYEGIKAYQNKYYYDNEWKPEYDRWVEMLYGMYQGAGRERVAYNQAQTSEMIFTQPVVQEFADIDVPTLLMIGMLDRTAPGANRAPDDVAAALGDYPQLARETAAAIPDATLVTFPDLGHSPQVQAPDEFHAALLGRLRR